MTDLDNRGAYISLNTRAGIDFVFELGVDDAVGDPVDLDGYTVETTLDDGLVKHDLVTVVEADKIRVHITAALTAALPAMARYSVEIVDPSGIRSSLVYGPVSCDRSYP